MAPELGNNIARIIRYLDITNAIAPTTVQHLRPRRQHILLIDLIHKGILGEHGEPSEAADHHGDHRQGQVPEVVPDLLQRAHLLEVLGSEAP